jgi:hypothetical protein
MQCHFNAPNRTPVQADTRVVQWNGESSFMGWALDFHVVFAARLYGTHTRQCCSSVPCIRRTFHSTCKHAPSDIDRRSTRSRALIHTHFRSKMVGNRKIFTISNNSHILYVRSLRNFATCLEKKLLIASPVVCRSGRRNVQKRCRFDLCSQRASSMSKHCRIRFGLLHVRGLP